MKTNEELRLAVDMLNLLNSDEEVASLAFKEVLEDIDRNSALAEREEIGEERGKEIGQRELIKK